MFCLLLNGQVVGTGASTTTNTEAPQSQGKNNKTPVISTGDALGGDSTSMPPSASPELKPSGGAPPPKKGKSPKKA